MYCSLRLRLPTEHCKLPIDFFLFFTKFIITLPIINLNLFAMEDHTNDDDKNLNKYKDRYNKSVTELQEEKELKTKWHKEILENPSLQEYFKKFHPVSIDTFISFYLTEKYLAYKYADSYERLVEEKRSRWIDAAHVHLKIIQHKKLFDLQCLWRAEQITLEEVQITYDFLIWQDDILNCPFIAPISKADIEMYQDYLLTADIDYKLSSDLYDLQNYDEFKEDYTSDGDEGSALPDWYEYHNLRTGNTALMILPDIRGDKEAFYKNLYREERQKSMPPSAPYVPENRPFLSTDDLQNMTFFVNTFENEETRKKYANYSEINKKNKSGDSRFNELLLKMELEDEHIPIEAHYDFKQALYTAYNKFNLKNIAAHLPLAHEQYLFNRKMGFTIASEDDFYKGLRDGVREMILNGREINGEPRDFNF